MSNSGDIYTDRFGKTHIPKQGDVTRPRHGVFIICCHQDQILTICPAHAPNTYELPGGGIDAGENATEALIREWGEETGLAPIFTNETPLKHITQDVLFYAEDVDEYWQYHQQYFVYQGDFSPIFFDDIRPTPEAGVMQWQNAQEIQKNPNTHHIHATAIRRLLAD